MDKYHRRPITLTIYSGWIEVLDPALIKYMKLYSGIFGSYFHMFTEETICNLKLRGS